jgi:deazaflavin-dependent oxidoreductase (nitroreductase family)
MNATVERFLGKGLVVHQWLYVHTDGRVGRSIGGRPMLLLRTVGRKTKEPRTNALLYVPVGDGFGVIASKGGDVRHPGWFHNLTANPDVEVQVGRERIPVRARVAEGDERQQIWDAANKVNDDQYDTYQSRTDRKIPVIVLERRTA